MTYVILPVASLVSYLIGLIIMRNLLKSQAPGSAGSFGCFWASAIVLVTWLFTMHKAVLDVIVAAILIFVLIILIIRIRR